MVEDHPQPSRREREGERPRAAVTTNLRTRVSSWKVLIGLAFACSLVPVVLAFTVHDRCRSSDPSCVFHTYTLVEAPGPWILGVIAAPMLISVIVALALKRKVTRRSARAENVAWSFAILSCVISLIGLVIIGFVMLVAAALTVGAVAVAPSPPDPADPLAAPGSGYFRAKTLDQS